MPGMDLQSITQTETTAAGPVRVVYQEEVAALHFDWGDIRMLCDGVHTGARQLSFGIVESKPGGSHALHCHPAAEEVIYVLCGDGELLTSGRPPLPITSGAMIFIPPGCLHATLNTGKDFMRVIIVYAPPGPERELPLLQGCSVVAPRPAHTGAAS